MERSRGASSGSAAATPPDPSARGATRPPAAPRAQAGCRARPVIRIEPDVPVLPLAHCVAPHAERPGKAYLPVVAGVEGAADIAEDLGRGLVVVRHVLPPLAAPPPAASRDGAAAGRALRCFAAGPWSIVYLTQAVSKPGTATAAPALAYVRFSTSRRTWPGFPLGGPGHDRKGRRVAPRWAPATVSLNRNELPVIDILEGIRKPKRASPVPRFIEGTSTPWAPPTAL
jgi:hypothetical protein